MCRVRFVLCARECQISFGRSPEGASTVEVQEEEPVEVIPLHQIFRVVIMSDLEKELGSSPVPSSVRELSKMLAVFTVRTHIRGEIEV